MNQKRENNTIPMHVAWNTIKATIRQLFCFSKWFQTSIATGLTKWSAEIAMEEQNRARQNSMYPSEGLLKKAYLLSTTIRWVFNKKHIVQAVKNTQIMQYLMIWMIRLNKNSKDRNHHQQVVGIKNLPEAGYHIKLGDMIW